MTDRERLVELLNFVKCNAECCAALDGGRCGELDYLDRCQIEAIAELLLADGWIRPPCKVGTKVYSIAMGKIYEWDIASFTVDGNGVSFINVAYMEGNNMYGNTCKVTDLDKVIFLSREEAERAVRKEDDGE